MSINLENKPGLSSFNQEDWTFGTIVDQFCPVPRKRKSFTAAQPSAEPLGRSGKAAIQQFDRG
jgi:hypothetical protein